MGCCHTEGLDSNEVTNFKDEMKIGTPTPTFNKTQGIDDLEQERERISNEIKRKWTERARL